MQRVEQDGITCMPGVARERLLDHDDDDVDENDDHYHDDNNNDESDEVGRKHRLDTTTNLNRRNRVL